MESKLISVIVPIYKVEDYLDQCIWSIVNQTYKNLEIILVDDGSPDSCPQKCDDWATKDSRIKVIHQKNSGASVARNAGLDFATGDYIGFVDSDDYISNSMYEELVVALEGSNKKMASCLVSRVFENGNIISDKKIKRKNMLLSAEEAIVASFYKLICNSVWCNLYEKSVFEKIRFQVGKTNEDYPIIIPSFIFADGTFLVNKSLYYYRKRSGSTTTEGYFSANNAKCMLENFSLIENQLRDNNLKCKKSFGFFLARNALDMALVMEKKYKFLDDSQKQLLSSYRKVMKKNAVFFLLSTRTSIKKKCLYFLVLTKSLRPIYKLLRKSF